MCNLPNYVGFLKNPLYSHGTGFSVTSEFPENDGALEDA